MDVSRSIHRVRVEGRHVSLRVFTPVQPSQKVAPTVVMVCGLAWLGGGALGCLGELYNDAFGRAFARHGISCVQLHTPARHLAHTRIVEVVGLLLWPLTFVPIVSIPVLVLDVIALATSFWQLLFLLVVPFVSLFGPLSLPSLHLSMRFVQWISRDIPFPKHVSAHQEIDAAVAWAQSHQELLRGNGCMVLCGYSSGGHCASLYATSPNSPCFDAVVLISSCCFDMQTDRWKGIKVLFAPVFNLIFAEILGVNSSQSRKSASPAFTVSEGDHHNESWYILSASSELMGIQPLQSILFDSQTFCDALRRKGAEIHNVSCGLNHWLLIFSVDAFISRFCAVLLQR